MSSRVVTLIALVLRLAAANASANSDAVPVWLQALVKEQQALLSGELGLARSPFLDLSYDPRGSDEGRRIIDADAEAQRVRIAYAGAWSRAAPDARRDAIRNLAHELAHVWQRELGMPTEPRLLHEGFAEAIAIQILDQCGQRCGVRPGALMALRERECGEALRRGALGKSDQRDAVYGCGAVLTSAMANAAGTSPQGLYRQFAKTGRDMEAFNALVETAAGPTFALSSRVFLKTNHRLAQPSRVIASLRAGRL